MPELRLAYALLLNALVLTAAWLAARRWTRDGVQRCADAMLLWYVVQYAAVGLPGLARMLSLASMSVVAVVAAAGMLVYARRSPALPMDGPTWERRTYFVGGLFLVALVVQFVHLQCVLPTIDTDAITYHVPAAVQWLQSGRLGIFPVWFFNPANGFSPLGGSTFIAWLIAPMGNDSLARWVQSPAIVLIFLALLQIARALGARPIAATLLALAAAGSRLATSEVANPRDDMFLAAFVLAAVAGFARPNLADRFGAWRVGAALGLALATKYTALISLPIVLLLLDAPRRAGWTRRQWGVALLAVALLAGPWYLRNALLTGNPLYPLELHAFGHHLLPGLFVTERSERLRTITGLRAVFVGGYHGLPAALAVPLAVAWAAGVVASLRRLREPLARACALGPILCVILFVAKSPYGEVRFVYPAVMLGFVIVAVPLERWLKRDARQAPVAAALAAVAIYTAYEAKVVLAEALAPAVAVAGVGAALVWAGSQRVRAYAVAAAATLLALGIYVYWNAYVEGYQFHEPEFWPLRQYYPTLAGGWSFVRENVPDDATIAYAQTYMPYPLYGDALRRRLLYVPVRADVTDFLHLPRFPHPLPGEQLNDEFTRLLDAGSDCDAWTRRLRDARAGWLFVYLAGPVADPPEGKLAAADPAHFQEVHRDPSVVIYKLNW